MIGSLSAFHSVLFWSVCRAIIVSGLGVVLAVWLWRGRRLSERPALMGMLLLPLFIPDLPVGYMWRLTAMKLTQSELMIEVLYAGLLLCRATAIQLLVLLILPGSSASSEALHSWKLQPARDLKWWRGWCRLWIAGPLKAPVVAWTVGMLACFQEFEIAALMQVDDYPVSWTVWLFDAQGKGEVLNHCLSWMLQGAGTQIVLLLPLLLFSGRSQADSQGAESQLLQGNGSAAIVLPSLFIGVNVLLSIVRPVWLHGESAVRGLQLLWRTGAFQETVAQILHSLVPSLLSALLALQIARVLERCRSRFWLVALCPGLCGALFVSLSLLALFQLPAFTWLWDTWIPMTVGQVVYALPRAWLLILVLRVTRPASQIQSAVMLTGGSGTRGSQGRSLLWRLGSLRWLLATALLTHWCFWDVTVISTLRPVYFEPVVTRLYDEMHYGHVDSLMARALLAIMIPVGVFALMAIVWQRSVRFVSGGSGE